MHFSVLSVLAFICTVLPPCNVILYILHCHKVRGLACHKTTFNHHFVLKCSAPSQEFGSWYIIVRYYVCCIVVFYVLQCSVFSCVLLIFNVFSSVLVCDLDFFLSRFMTFEQRYTTVAFI